MDSTHSLPSEVDFLLEGDPFQNEENQKLFDAIDELRSCGANQDIELPEVCTSFHHHQCGRR